MVPKKCDYYFGLGMNCFEDSDVTSMIIPTNITSIKEECFFGCSKLTSITLSSNLKELDDRCFYKCYQLKEITIPSSVTKFGSLIFDFCSSLTKINCANNEYPGVLGLKEAFLFKQLGIKCDKIAILNSDYEELKMIPPQVEYLKCFYDNQLIKELILPTTIKQILPHGICAAELLTKVIIYCYHYYM